jgi:rRNA maturation RNase YbeY
MITYNAEGVKMPNVRRRELSAWIRRVAATYGKRVGEVGYLFCDDEKILEVNREYLRHDYYTDIITFDYCEGDLLNGDLVISLDTVRSNSEMFDKEYDTERFSSPYEAELYRVIIHGILHLCGLNDKAPGEREQMEAAENRALALLTATK